MAALRKPTSYIRDISKTIPTSSDLLHFWSRDCKASKHIDGRTNAHTKPQTLINGLQNKTESSLSNTGGKIQYKYYGSSKTGYRSGSAGTHGTHNSKESDACRAFTCWGWLLLVPSVWQADLAFAVLMFWLYGSSVSLLHHSKSATPYSNNPWPTGSRHNRLKITRGLLLPPFSLSLLFPTLHLPLGGQQHPFLHSEEERLQSAQWYRSRHSALLCISTRITKKLIGSFHIHIKTQHTP